MSLTTFRRRILSVCWVIIALIFSFERYSSTTARATEAPSEFCGTLQPSSSPQMIWNDAQWSKAYPTFNKAMGLDGRSDFGSAIKQYQIGLNIFPNNVEQRLRLGVDYDRLGETASADQEWREAVRIAGRGGMGENLYCRGDTLFRAHAFRNAFETYLASEYPAEGPLASDMNVLYLDSGAAPLIRQGLASAAAGNFGSALHQLEAAKTLAPSLQHSNFFLADLRYQAGDVHAARIYWEAVLDNSGTRSPDQHGPDRIQLAAATMLLWMDGNYAGRM